MKLQKKDVKHTQKDLICLPFSENVEFYLKLQNYKKKYYTLKKNTHKPTYKKKTCGTA